jgi:hypothetical protein
MRVAPLTFTEVTGARHISILCGIAKVLPPTIFNKVV